MRAICTVPSFGKPFFALILGALAVIFCLTDSRSFAAVAFTTQHGATINAFDAMISTSDLIHGKSILDTDVYENPMDSFGHPSNVGWHPVNTDPADQLAAFTDGIGMRPSGLTGLLNDFPPTSGSPTKIVQYPFSTPVDIGRINILTGNNNPDGRIFSTTYIEYSTNNGSTFQPLGYFQSDPSGSGNTTNRTTLVSVFDDASSTLVSGVTDLIFNLYSVSNTANGMQDPYDGLNQFTNTDDGLAKAFESPLVLELDVLAPVAGVPGDYNGNSVVDAADYVVWRANVGEATLLNRVPGIEGPIGGDDYEAWRARFGNISGSGTGVATLSIVPEPATFVVWISLVGTLAVTRFRGTVKRLGETPLSA